MAFNLSSVRWEMCLCMTGGHACSYVHAMIHATAHQQHLSIRSVGAKVEIGLSMQQMGCDWQIALRRPPGYGCETESDRWPSPWWSDRKAKPWPYNASRRWRPTLNWQSLLPARIPSDLPLLHYLLLSCPLHSLLSLPVYFHPASLCWILVRSESFQVPQSWVLGLSSR